ncbi:hypothetical protein V3C33_11610 [Micrococcaceae bacterium Sec5.7]
MFGPAGVNDTQVQKSALYVAIVASFMALLDGSAVNLALPAIGRELGGCWCSAWAWPSLRSLDW